MQDLIKETLRQKTKIRTYAFSTYDIQPRHICKNIFTAIENRVNNYYLDHRHHLIDIIFSCLIYLLRIASNWIMLATRITETILLYQLRFSYTDNQVSICSLLFPSHVSRLNYNLIAAT